MKKNTNQNLSIKSFKIVLIILAFAVIGSLFYVYNSTERHRNVIISLRQEKSLVLKDLEKSELFLNQIMTTNKSLSNKLSLEKEKVSKLILELKSKPFTEKNIIVYKSVASNIDNRIKLLLQQINSYKKKIDSTNVVLKVEKIKNDTLTTSNNKLIKKVSVASKLYYYDLQTTFFKVKSSGKQQETNKASKIDLIKISFMIAENSFAKEFKKNYYVQIIDTKNNILGKKETLTFGDKTLDFGAIISVIYDKSTLKAETEIPVSNLEKGKYAIIVFDKTKIILNSGFELI
jgi:hypothetical protein